ncbi:MAG TPA: sensor histidine kinase [Candidatus Merdenecus merdavium]|nr:sensor histidine kinase [Candidatus Merdenecus merdavium]
MDELLIERIYNVVFLFISTNLFLIPMKKRDRFKGRILICFSTLLGFLVISTKIHEFIPGFSRFEWIIIYILAIFMIYLCANIFFMSAMYIAVWILMSVQICYEFSIMVFYFASRGGLVPLESRVPVQISIAIVFYIAMALVLWRLLPKNKEYHTGPRQLTLSLLMLLILEYLYWLGYGSSNSIWGNKNWFLIFIMQLYCITILYLQDELFRNSAMRQELQTLNWIQNSQKEQYELSKENIALINQKCHDLKHQINALRTMTNHEEREKYLDEVSQSIRIYESIIHTGNEVLDTILTDKSLYCQANHIQINCVVDGKKLDFIDSLDLYSIFGNALDNAIEKVKKFEVMDKRIIDVIVHTQFEFLIIEIENPLEGNIDFHDDLPVSTKEKNGYHGFGLKSIRHTAEKYNGQIYVSTERGSFSLKVMIPLQSK